MVLVDNTKEISVGGFIVSAKNEKEGGKLQKGTIIKIGKKCDEPLLKINSVIYYNTYDAFEIEQENGVLWAVVPVTGIWAVVSQ